MQKYYEKVYYRNRKLYSLNAVYRQHNQNDFMYYVIPGMFQIWTLIYAIILLIILLICFDIEQISVDMTMHLLNLDEGEGDNQVKNTTNLQFHPGNWRPG